MNIKALSEEQITEMLQYVQEAFKYWEIEMGWDFIGSRVGIPSEFATRIASRVDEWCCDNSIEPDTIWAEVDEQEIFEEFN